MMIQDLQKQIVDNKLDDLYIFVGEEIEVLKRYVNKIIQISGLQPIYADCYKDICHELGTTGLFNVNHIYIITYDDDIISHEDVWKDIKTNGNIIIFKYVDLDKRSKFYKYFENKIVSFEKLSNDVLKGYIKKDIDLNNDNCYKLIDACNNDYSRILLEIDKIKNYDWDLPYKITSDIAFDELYSKNVFCDYEEDVTFKFVEAIVTRNYVGVKNYLKSFIEYSNGYLGLLTLLYNNFKSILLVQSCKSSNISDATGLTSAQVFYAKKKCNNYTTGELVDILRMLQRLDVKVKKGLIEEKILLDYILVNIIL